MGELVGDVVWEDYGNAPEVFIESKAVAAWERVEGGLIRLFVCRNIHGRLVLDHTDVMTKATMIAIGKRFLEIANAADGGPLQWAETINSMVC